MIWCFQSLLGRFPNSTATSQTFSQLARWAKIMGGDGRARKWSPKGYGVLRVFDQKWPPLFSQKSTGWSLVGGLEHVLFFIIFPYIGNIHPKELTNIFQRGWNHQPLSCSHWNGQLFLRYPRSFRRRQTYRFDWAHPSSVGVRGKHHFFTGKSTINGHVP